MNGIYPKEKITFIQKKLNKLYSNPPPPLIHNSPYELMIAVLLSAQCTDKVVNKVTPNLFKLANNPWDMSKLNLSIIKKNIKSCGLYPKKSIAIKKLSKILVDKYKGEIPNTIEELEALPGVGHKTASVVMVQVYKKPAFPVDTHIHRLAERWGISTGKNVKQTEKDIKNYFPSRSWGKLHLQMIYYGREYCPARNHQINNCPICLKLSQF